MLPRRIPLLFFVLSSFSSAAKVDDSIHYLITFERADSGLEGGQLLEDNEKALKDDNSLRISTQNNENYICKMPDAPATREEDISAYTGPTPLELLAPVYKEKLCSYRVEPYWSYELCHGRYIVQYHEEKDVRGVGRTAEYYLGNLHVDYTTVASSADYSNPPKKVIDGEEHAYFPVFYSQGTTCDITGKPRTTTVMYICIENARNQIHSLSEVSSCNYEVVVLSSRLCTHPAYRRKAQRDQEIICYNTDNNENSKPLSLVQMEAYHRDTFKREYSIREQHTNIEIEDEKDDGKLIKEVEEPEKEKPLRLAGNKRHDGVDSLANNRLIVEDTVNRIISGRECIYGGEGWWKYEFCYGKSVLQYHLEQNGERTDILLGVFDEKIHKAWIDDDPKQRSPKKYNGQIMQVSHIYTKGSICHEVRAHRFDLILELYVCNIFRKGCNYPEIKEWMCFSSESPDWNTMLNTLSVEVRLRCKTAEGSPLAISLSLTEPKLCQYILTIESERFCEPLQYADEYGLIALEPLDESAERLPGPI